MPGQRMLHPEQSTSRKVTALTDFEYRVYEQTKLSSDDFGVMPYTATVLRADNLRLRGAKENVVFAALKRMVLAGLLLLWKHQDEEYVCAPVWQTWQQIRFPRKTSRPKPPAETIAACDEQTRELFGKHPGGRPKDSGQSSDKVPSSVGSKSGTSDGEVPANANASANASAHANANAPRSSPLIVSPIQFEKAQKSFAFYGSRLKVPHVLHSELRDKFGGENPDSVLQSWYLTLNDAAEESKEPIPDVFAWLRPKFVEFANTAAFDAEMAKCRPRGVR